MYYLQGKNEEAIKTLQRALELRPDILGANLFLGMAYVRTNQYEKSLDPLRKAISLNPKEARAYLNLGLSYSELGRDVEARAELAELLRVIPNDSLEGARRVLPFKDPADLERYLVALRKAGLQ